ncbi:Hsp20/alpha crystallin family protein [Arthrobacter sp. zg-ZUI100]|uniref:Hsp20/alpha crystallin family protein n=1 Tax=Arthrobacter jiangjiafuii TaxID=2817475 RepID=A0A975M7J0_9MICC|nr:Hsp20/alpha crystallin family protein [Arthrobacter jiangjiafuii]MBP3043839.1 Hsp20/alpha crystallin family protein [Arthrobacter jiangjiafuii]QWC10856.1 Hsp20/alpha crystallin family protein [Arthrobacter jiangjiafuii]
MAMKFDPFRELDRVAGALLDPRQRLRLMPIDLYREGDHYILNADLPGIDPGSVDVDVDGQLLTIRAERTIQTSEGVNWLTRERESGSFLRQLNLGQGINIEGISAKYENGVLSVLIPVSERAKPRKIEVSSSYKDSNTISGESSSESVTSSVSGSGGSGSGSGSGSMGSGSGGSGSGSMGSGGSGSGSSGSGSSGDQGSGI